VGEGQASRNVQAGAEDERRRPEEAVAIAEAALGAGEDEAGGEGEVGQAVVCSRSLAVPQGFFFGSKRPIRL
jgi:hypothetical protein